MPLNFGRVQRGSPSPSGDGVSEELRLDPTGAVHTRAEMLAWLEQGSYFRATNPTLGTGIAQSIQASFAATNAALLMRCGANNRLIVPHYIRLINTIAGATTTQSRAALVLDTANRYSSGGTDLLAQVFNSHSGLSTASVVDVLRFGAVTASAAVAARVVANLSLKVQAAPCWVVGDEVRINFSPTGDADPGALNGAAPTAFVKNVGPVILGGQNHCLLLHLWNVANATTAPSWELDMAWWELPIP